MVRPKSVGSSLNIHFLSSFTDQQRAVNRAKCCKNAKRTKPSVTWKTTRLSENDQINHLFWRNLVRAPFVHCSPILNWKIYLFFCIWLALGSLCCNPFGKSWAKEKRDFINNHLLFGSGLEWRASNLALGSNSRKSVRKFISFRGKYE